MASQPQNSILAPVVSFDSRKSARFIHTVYQEDFQDIVTLRAEFRKTRKKLEDAEDRVKLALKNGARVEPGALTPALLEFQRSGYTVPPGSVTKLLIE